MKHYRTLLAPKNETWRAALERYTLFLETEMQEYFDTKDYSYHFRDNRSYDLNIQETVSPALIADFEIRTGINVPGSLTDMLCRHGGFSIGEGLIDIFGGYEQAVFPNLQQMLEKTGNSSFASEIPSGMLKSLNGFYYFFGISFPNSDEMAFLYFSKAGNFGKMLFAPDNKELVLKKILPAMFNGSAEKFTLDSLLSNQIDRVITNALTVKGYID
ncbi:hypothetical protein [Dysgonomonas macrotermitis]|uniref:Uncharacterized protein n=1 Tax=Dysgonomonas macrotermitis TaxID=1346286 RepID=A0A1M5HCJ4_9BACT|nr:hypothetical protein [Dysgonomonas macrotermitis]SHG13685.1 hypothetical protein SAMN05444362_11624 [Dysgonomonas macrotermitis]